MDLTRYVDALRQELLVAAEASDKEAVAVAERLIAPLSSAIRLVLLDALSAAADEITRDLAPRAVEVRLRGVDPSFVVTPATPEGGFDEAAADGFGPVYGDVLPTRPPLAAVQTSGEESTTSRINFRPPEHLKARIEQAAGREGLSVNAWLVRAVSAVLDLEDSRRPGRRTPHSGQRYTGWVT